MEVISKETAASVVLVRARVSEDEISVFALALDYILETLDAFEIENRFGATRDEIEAMRDDLGEILADRSEAAQKSEPLLKVT